ncbi:MAG: TlpA disulfide reductase family protein [Proteocatella sp.]
MKKLISLGLGLIISAGILTGCGDPKVEETVNTPVVIENGAYVNSEYDKASMVKLDGTEFSLADETNSYGEKDLGFGITYTDTMEKLKGEDKLGATVTFPYSMLLSYAPQAVINKVKSTKFEDMSEDEQMEFWKNLDSFEVAGIFRMPEDDDNAKEDFEFFSKFYEKTEAMATVEEDTYYIGYNTDYSNLELSESEKTELATIVEELEIFKNGIFVFPYTDTRTLPFDGDMKEFKAETLSGETVTPDVFKDYDLTMVNVWATWCGPCVGELPEISELYGKLPENVNLITVCTDGADDPETAKEIYDSVNGQFKVLIPDVKLDESFVKYIDALPTTVFVDRDGMVVGMPITGAPAKEGEIAEAYMEAINENLALIGK